MSEESVGIVGRDGRIRYNSVPQRAPARGRVARPKPAAKSVAKPAAKPADVKVAAPKARTPRRPFKINIALLQMAGAFGSILPRRVRMPFAGLLGALATCGASSSAPVTMPELPVARPVVEANLVRALPRAPVFDFGLPILQSDLPANCDGALLVSDFGPRRDPFGAGTQIHYGLDLGRPFCDGQRMSPEAFAGTPIRAMQSGIVIDYNASGAAYGATRGGRGYGHNLLVISRPDGDQSCAWREEDQGAVVIRYGHMSRPMTEQGESPVCRWVERGDIVGYVGSTGRSQNVHLDVRAGHVSLVEGGGRWMPARINYFNLAGPGLMDMSAYPVSSSLNLNVSANEYDVAWGGIVRRRARIIDEPGPIPLIEVEEEEVDGLQDDDGTDVGVEGDEPDILLDVRGVEPLLVVADEGPTILTRPLDQQVITVASGDLNVGAHTP